MRCHPNTHSYSYTDADGYTYSYANLYSYYDADCNANSNSDSDPYTHAYANINRYSQTYPFTKIQSVAKASSHPRATAVDLVGRRRCSSQAFGHRRDRRRIRG